MKKTVLLKSCLLVIMAFIIGFPAAGCSFLSSEEPQQSYHADELKDKPRIRIAHSWDAETALNNEFNEKFSKFAEENADLASYTIEAERGDRLRDKIRIDMASENLPDIFYYWALTSLKPMYEKNLLLDVNEYFNVSEKVKAEDFVQYALDAYSPDGEKIYAIPITGSLDYFACNRELFSKFGLNYPRTYDELLEVSKVFRANGITPLAVGSKGGNPAHFLFAEVYYQFGSLDYMEKVTTAENRFDYEINRKTADIILEMARNGVFPEDTVASGYFASSVSLYNKEKAAMILGQAWSIRYFDSDIIEKTDLITFPEFKDAVNKPSEFCVGGVNNGWVISRASFEDPDKKEAMIKAVDFLVSDDVMTLLIKNGEHSMKKIDPDPSIISPLYKKVIDFTQNQKLLTNFWILMPDPTSQEVLSIAMDELWAQSIDAEEFCRKIQASIDKANQK